MTEIDDTMLSAVDSGYIRRNELLETISELEHGSPARLAALVSLSEIDRTIRQAKANYEIVAALNF